MLKYFVGSSAQDNLGIGNIYIGFQVKKTESGYSMQIDPFEWIEIFDFMVVEDGGVRSPHDSDLTK